ncbi:hypothetical protein JXQ70_02815 [bacterium]|nr:hypothetical protein [bacterium]
MKSSSCFSKAERAVLVLVIMAGIVIQALIIGQDFDVLVRKVVADDMFYYLSIARNLATGYGPTFDGSVETNGFHPILLLLEIPIFWMLPLEAHDTILPVRIVLILVTLFHALTGFFLYVIIRMITRVGALFSLVLWMFHPQIVLTALSGVEAPLAALFVTVALFWLLHCDRTGQPFQAAILGFLAGLVLLTRTDCILFSLMLAGTYICWQIKGPSRSPLRNILTLAGAGSLVILPWVFWNMKHFGRITQDSGRALSFLYHYLNRSEGITDYFRHAFHYSCETVTMLGEMWTGSVALAVAFWCLIMALFCSSFSHKTELKKAILLIGSVHFLFIFFFYSGYFWHIQRWYFMSLFPIGLIFIGVGLGDFWSKISDRWAHSTKLAIGLVFIMTIGVTLVFWSARIWAVGIYPWQTVSIRAAEQLGPHLKPGEMVGALNAGLLGYLLPNRVVNLDGVVNGDVYQSFQDKQWTEYLHSRTIRYLADFDRIIRCFGPLGDERELSRWQLMIQWHDQTFPTFFVILYIPPLPD